MDGQPRGDMVGSFVKHIPGFSYEMNSSVIVSKIRAPQVDIMIKDLKFALNVLKKEIKDRNMSEAYVDRTFNYCPFFKIRIIL